MMKSKAIITFLFAGVIVAGLLVGRSIHSDPVSNKIESADKMRDHRPNETNQKLDRSWNELIEKFNIDVSDLFQVDYSDNHHIWEKFKRNEQISFTDSLKKAMESHKIGDLLPVLLIDKDATKTIMLFHRDDGKGKAVKVILSTRNTTKGKEWFVDGVPEER
ncbi:hypothetical protein [Paenibacillus apiarius]|uniref:hypothetical protein n=1 Tax=Paenibacillus apiarius TaxID=46240 RepID=UPI003B3A5DE9